MPSALCRAESIRCVPGAGATTARARGSSPVTVATRPSGGTAAHPVATRSKEAPAARVTRPTVARPALAGGSGYDRGVSAAEHKRPSSWQSLGHELSRSRPRARGRSRGRLHAARGSHGIRSRRFRSGSVLECEPRGLRDAAGRIELRSACPERRVFCRRRLRAGALLSSDRMRGQDGRAGLQGQGLHHGVPGRNARLRRHVRVRSRKMRGVHPASVARCRARRDHRRAPIAARASARAKIRRLRRTRNTGSAGRVSPPRRVGRTVSIRTRPSSRPYA